MRIFFTRFVAFRVKSYFHLVREERRGESSNKALREGSEKQQPSATGFFGGDGNGRSVSVSLRLKSLYKERSILKIPANYPLLEIKANAH